MQRARVLDPSAVATALLAAAVFAVAVLAITGVAVRAADGPDLFFDPLGGYPIGADWTGFHLEVATHSGELYPGGWANYLVVYENLGPVTETVRITETWPTGGVFERAWWGDGDQPNAGEDLPQPVWQTDTAVAWELPPVGRRQPRWFHVEVAFPAGVPLNPSNCVLIAQASDETTTADNGACAGHALNPVGPNLAVAKTGEWQLPDMDHLLYEIRYWNWGNSASFEVPITDTLPAGTELVSVWTSDPDANCSAGGGAISVTCIVPQLPPGAFGRIWLDVALDQPPQPLQSFTNTVAIATPQGDVAPDDNTFEDGASTGGEVREVAFAVATEHSSMLVFTPLVESTGWITVTTPAGQYTIHPDPVCQCAELPDIGPVWPGDTVVVAAGEASQPVTMTVPTPFEAEAFSDNDTVSGFIDGLLDESVEVILHGGPVRLAMTSAGFFQAFFPDVPRGGTGEVRYRTTQDYADVVFRGFFYTQDLVLNVHSRDDWVEGLYEVGHTVWITVTDSLGAVKATSELQTWSPPWWGGMSGFTTQIDGAWIPEPPDILPGDWVYGLVDSGFAATTKVGAITGALDYDADVITGTIEAPWLQGFLLEGECVALVGEFPTQRFSEVDPIGGVYTCDFGGFWDLQPGDEVLVRYWDPDANSVMNQFPEAQPQLGIDKYGEGAPTTGGNYEYTISYWNDGPTVAENTVVTDTLPAGTSYITSTMTITPTVAGQTVRFDVGALEAGAQVEFLLFAHVSAPVANPLVNQVEIAAANVVTDPVPPVEWPTVVQENATDLAVAASPSDPDPMPLSELVWHVEVCNVGPTSSAEVVLTDAVPAETTLLGWTADQPGWTEAAMTTDELVVERPTVSGGGCLQLHLATELTPNAPPGWELCNQVVVGTSNDVNPANNEHRVCVTVGGAAPAVELQKRTNGQDADDPPGPSIPAGSPVEWHYEVTNTGNVALEAIVVEDDQPGVVPFCPPGPLEPGATRTCEANGLAIEGPYANVGTVTAIPASGGDPVMASDPSHYFGLPSGLPFADGFESGDTSAWSATVP